jgi:hypothetical protein
MSSSSSSVYPSPSTRTCPAVYFHKHIARARIHSIEATARIGDSAVPRARQGRRAGRAVGNAVPRARQCPASCTQSRVHDGSPGDQRQQRMYLLRPQAGCRDALSQGPPTAAFCLQTPRLWLPCAGRKHSCPGSDLCRAGPQYIEVLLRCSPRKLYRRVLRLLVLALGPSYTSIEVRSRRVLRLLVLALGPSYTSIEVLSRRVLRCSCWP